MTHLRLLLLIALALAVAVPPAASGQTRPPKAPKSGWSYGGQPGDVFIQIAGRSIEIAAFSFPCGDVWGRTSINDFRLKRTSRGYRFNADTNGLVTYTDETDSNAKIHFSGRFALDAKTVRGHIRIESPRCKTGDLKWKGVRLKS